MSRNAIGAMLVAMVVIIGALPGATALITPPPAPPENFSGEYDNETRSVQLFWDPPSGDTAYTYNVYRDGELVNETDETDYSERLNIESDAVASVYYVTAVSEAAQHESPPSAPFFVFADAVCSPVIISFKPDGNPPAGGGIDDGCVEMYKRTIDRLISDSPINFDLIDPEDILW